MHTTRRRIFIQLSRFLIVVTILWVCFVLIYLKKDTLKYAFSRTNPTFSPNIDQRKYTEKDLIQIIRHKNNIPVEFWYTLTGPKSNKCANPPSIFDLNYSNIHWQTSTTSNGTFHLFGAYLDTRPRNPGPKIRILGMVDRLHPNVTTYCQLWFNGTNEPVISIVNEYRLIWYPEWGRGKYYPYLITCSVPESHRDLTPNAVSLVENQCETPTTFLKVEYNLPAEKKQLAVCVKGLDFPYQDLSVKITEWIELLGLLGVNKIFFYELEVHANISKVLRYYEDKGRIDVTPITLPGTQPNLQLLQHIYLKKHITSKRLNEVIPYNDCLLKHMYEYQHVLLLDIDEMIIPTTLNTLTEMMDRVVSNSLIGKQEGYSTYCASNTYFLDVIQPKQFDDDGEIPSYLHMMRNIYRTNNHTKPGQYIKCIHDAQRVLILHNHFPIWCLEGWCPSYNIPLEDGHLQHYRHDCDYIPKCREFKEDVIEDGRIRRYRIPLVNNVWKTLSDLNYFL